MSGKIDVLKDLKWNSQLLRISRHGFLIAGLVAATGAAAAQNSGQNTIPDAQVEANVLKALAGAPDLANEQITTRTVYGTVTLSGSVTSEDARTKAENLAANANGVQKVVDELTLGSGQQTAQNSAQPAAQPSTDNAAPMLLQSDGTYAPANGQTPAPGTAPAAIAQRNNPDADQALDQQMAQQAAQGQQQPTQQNPAPGQPQATANGQPAYSPQPYSRRPVYPNYPGYTPYPYGYPPATQPGAGAYAQQPYAQQSGQPPMGAQAAGQPVTVPAGALLRVRINHTLDSNHTQPGTAFDGTVINDVVANGFVAIPRGATVQGKVVDSKSSGALTGHGELSIQLTSLMLGGKTYPLATDSWSRNGNDKTAETVGKTAGIGILGAILGAAVDGGRGAAIGGGVGAAAGLGSSAASGNGQVFLPAEAIVNFHTVGETQVATVSEQEMQRLAYGAGPNADQAPVRRVYRVYPGYYPPPGYYPYPYPAAGYPPY